MDNSKLYNKIIASISKTVKQTLNENKCEHRISATQVGEPITQFYKGYEIEVSKWRCDQCGEESWGYMICPWPGEDYIAEDGYTSDTVAFIAAKKTIDMNINKHVIKDHSKRTTLY